MTIKHMEITNQDPRMELQLSKELEDMIEKAGGRRLLIGFINDLGVRLSVPVDTLTDEDCHKTCRAVIRSLRDYEGKELCQ